jgi:hypothetical protein
LKAAKPIEACRQGEIEYEAFGLACRQGGTGFERFGSACRQGRVKARGSLFLAGKEE